MQGTIEIPIEDAERFVKAAQAAVGPGFEFDPLWELPEKFGWALSYAQAGWSAHTVRVTGDAPPEAAPEPAAEVPTELLYDQTVDELADDFEGWWRCRSG